MSCCRQLLDMFGEISRLWIHSCLALAGFWTYFMKFPGSGSILALLPPAFGHLLGYFPVLDPFSPCCRRLLDIFYEIFLLWIHSRIAAAGFWTSFVKFPCSGSILVLLPPAFGHILGNFPALDPFSPCNRWLLDIFYEISRLWIHSRTAAAGFWTSFVKFPCSGSNLALRLLSFGHLLCNFPALNPISHRTCRLFGTFPRHFSKKDPISHRYRSLLVPFHDILLKNIQSRTATALFWYLSMTFFYKISNLAPLLLSFGHFL